MKSSWSGYPGIKLEGFAVAVSQVGWDRTREHSLPSDEVVVRLRCMVLKAIDRFTQGEAPPACGTADMTGIIAHDNMLTNLLKMYRVRKPAKRIRYSEDA